MAGRSVAIGRLFNREREIVFASGRGWSLVIGLMVPRLDTRFAVYPQMLSMWRGAPGRAWPYCTVVVIPCKDAKGAWVEPGPSPLRRRCLSAVSDSLLDPDFHLFSYPRHPASSEPYPGRELAGGFESRDVSKTVWNTINRFEFLLRYQLPCHRKSLVKGTLQRPVSQLTGREEHTPA